MITISSSARSRSAPSRQLACVIAMMTTLTAVVTFASAASAQVRYGTPDEAVAALIGAVKAGDSKALVQVLGPDGEDIRYPGDPIADAANRKRVVEAYDAKHQVVREGDDKVMLIVGPEDWPF